MTKSDLERLLVARHVGKHKPDQLVLLVQSGQNGAARLTANETSWNEHNVASVSRRPAVRLRKRNSGRVHFLGLLGVLGRLCEPQTNI